MIRGTGALMYLGLFSNCKWARTPGFFTEPGERMNMLQVGHILVSRIGDAG
jgi:hypothetical protein